MSTNIAVYADWVGLAEPTRLGWLYARRGAGREVFEFAFESAALANSGFRGMHLDPRLGHFEGCQHPPQGQEIFGVFADSSPDRWGRTLMRRRLERAQRTGSVDKSFLVGCKEVARQWPTIARSLRIPDREQLRMAAAFKLAD